MFGLATAMVVKITLSLPMSKANFTADKQTALKASLARVAGVSDKDVTIDKIESITSGRNLTVRVEASVKAGGIAAANEIVGKMTADNINDELQKKTGLLAVIVLVPAKSQSASDSGELLPAVDTHRLCAC